MSAVVGREDAVGIDVQPGGLDDGAHRHGVERLRRAHEDALERRHMLDADVLGEVGNLGHVAQGGTTCTGAVERCRKLAQRPCKVHAVGSGFSGHGAVIAHPGGGVHPAISKGSVGAIEAAQTTQALGFKAIDRPADVDHVRAECVRREPVDGLLDECINRRMHGVFRVRDRERFHAQIVPNTCSHAHENQHGQTLSA